MKINFSFHIWAPVEYDLPVGAPDFDRLNSTKKTQFEKYKNFWYNYYTIKKKWGILMGKDIEDYVWVFLTHDYTDSRAYIYGLYTTYAALQEEIEFLETQGTGHKVYDYEQVPLN